MGQQTVYTGNAANDGTGDPLRTAFTKVVDNFAELYALQSRTVNAGDVVWAGLATVELRIQAAIDYAVANNAERVYVPANMLPYDASLVTFNTTVQMVREGGDWSVYDIKAYGADGDGVTDDAPRIQKLLNLLVGDTSVQNFPIFVPPGDYLLGTTISTPNSASQFSITGSGSLRPSRFIWGGAAGIPMFELVNPRWVHLRDLAFFNASANLPSDGVLVHRTGSITGAPAPTACRFDNVYIGGDNTGGSIVNGLHFQNEVGLFNNEQHQITNCFITNCSGRGLWLDGADIREVRIVGGAIDALTAAISNVGQGGRGNGTFVMFGTYASSTSGTVFELGGGENSIAVYGVDMEGAAKFITTPASITKNHSYIFDGCHYAGQSGEVIKFDSTLGTLMLRSCYLGGTALTYSFPTAGATVVIDGSTLNADTMTYNCALEITHSNGLSGSTTFTNSGSGYLLMRDGRGGFTQYNTNANDGDRGNNSITLTAGVDRETQMFNTPLTVDRTVTLSATNAQSGNRFRIVRMQDATGAGILRIGTTVLAAGQWSEWTYSSTFGGWQKTAGGTLFPAQLVVASEAYVVAGPDVDCGGYSAFQVTLTAARTIGAPTNATMGQRLVFIFLQDGTGGWAVTWNAVFKQAWSDTGNTATKRSSIAFIYDGTNWNQDGAQSPYI